MQQEAQINQNQGFVQSHNETHSQIDRFLTILSKPSQERTSKQIATLLEYVPMNKGLNQLAQKVSIKFVKTLLMKYAQPICIGPGQTIAKNGDKIKSIFILIYGKVVTDQKQQTIHVQGNSAFEKLGIIARSEVRQMNRMKKKRPTRRLSIDLLSQIKDYAFTCAKSQAFNLSEFKQTFVIGAYDRSQGQKYLSNNVVVEGSLFLDISIKGFLHAIANNTQQKINNIYQQIHRYPCFLGLERDVIQNFILALCEKKQKRGHHIYNQGDSVNSIYLLSSGEIKLTKQSNLFVQNPNNLYANRLSLLVQNTKQNQKIKARYQIKQAQLKKAQASLPYADLSLIYNFSPKKKTIQLTRIHAFCVFGGQQLTQGKTKTRETNAICNTLEVKYYEINVQKIKQIIGAKNMGTFIRGLQALAKDKVLHRQTHFANTIHFQNKSNLNYFYFDGEHEKKSHHKIRILKLNSKIQGKDKKGNYKSLDKQLKNKQTTSNVLPHFTAFNFHKINDLPPSPIKNNFKIASKLNLNHANPENHQENFKQDAHMKNQQQAEQTIQISHENKQQMNIMNMTHTWKLIKKKVDAEMVKSQKLSPHKFVIDVNEPLIDNNFFHNLDKQKRRIQRKIRKDRITLGQSRATSIIAKRTFNA